MTDHHDPLDELASAYLDGVASPDEVAQVEADPDLQARVEALRTVRGLLRADVSVDPQRREAAIAAALAAYGEADAPVGADAPVEAGEAVTNLADVAARRGSGGRALRWVGAVAAALLLAALVPLIGRLSDSSDQDEASSASEDAAQPELAEGLDGQAAGDEAADATTTTAPSAPAADDLGAYPDLEALIAALRTESGQPRMQSTEASGGSDSSCGGPPDSDGAEATSTGRALVAGSEVVVVVTERDGVRTATVLDPASGCEVLAEVQL